MNENYKNIDMGTAPISVRAYHLLDKNNICDAESLSRLSVGELCSILRYNAHDVGEVAGLLCEAASVPQPNDNVSGHSEPTPLPGGACKLSAGAHEFVSNNDMYCSVCNGVVLISYDVVNDSWRREDIDLIARLLQAERIAKEKLCNYSMDEISSLVEAKLNDAAESFSDDVTIALP